MTNSLVNEMPRTSLVKTAVGSAFVAPNGCLRCGGLLVADHCLDLLNSTGQLDVEVMRCVQCGEIIDPVILSHRRAQRAGHVAARAAAGRHGRQADAEAA